MTADSGCKSCPVPYGSLGFFFFFLKERREFITITKVSWENKTMDEQSNSKRFHLRKN